MSKKVFTVIATFAIGFAMTLSGCSLNGQPNPDEYVKASLDYEKTGTFSEEIEFSDEAKAMLKEARNEEMSKLENDCPVQMIVTPGVSGTDGNDSKTVKKEIERYKNNCVSNIKYNVSEEYKELDDGKYEVTVTVKPEKFKEEYEQYMYSKLMPEWIDKISDYSSTEEYHEAWLAAIVKGLADAAEEPKYADPVKVVFELSEKDGVYVIKKECMEEFWNTCIPQ